MLNIQQQTFHSILSNQKPISHQIKKADWIFPVSFFERHYQKKEV